MTFRDQILESGDWRDGASAKVDARIAIAGLVKPEICNVIALNDVVRPPDNIGGYGEGAKRQQGEKPARQNHA